MSKRIYDLFTRIYRRYDFMNHFFSLGMDKMWRRRAELLALGNDMCSKVIDIGAGTCDLSIGIALRARKADRDIRIYALDINERMLSLGRKKAEAGGLNSIRFVKGDALSIRCRNGSFDTMVSAFVLRNLDDFDKFAKEAVRVLSPGGRIVLLDMSMPDGPSRHFFMAYFRAMRLIGRIVDKEAYEWLTGSVSVYDKRKAAANLRRRGFRGVEIETLFPGVAFIIKGTRQ